MRASLQALFALGVLSALLAACSRTVPRAPGDEIDKPPGIPQPPSSAAPPQPLPEPEAGPPAQRFRVVGTEPFWAIAVDGETLRFSTPDDQAGRPLQAPPRATARGVAYRGMDGGNAFTLELEASPCSDGMSDRVYEFTARFDHGDRHYRGCASREP